MADASLEFLIDADHLQFYVQDVAPYDAWMAAPSTDPDLPPAGWTEEAVHLHRIGVEPHSISVGTARDDLVESLIAVHTAAPVVEPMAEHVVEADLDAPTGRLTMCSRGVDPDDGPSLTVPAGLLRARISYIPSGPPAVQTNGGPGDHFLYRIDLWPTGRPGGLVVLRQGPSAFGG